MKKQASLGVVRWGAEAISDVPAGTTRPVNQFVDFNLDVPQSVDIVLIATSTVPVAGLSVRFIVQVGIGSTNHVERFVIAVQDVEAQAPIVLRRAVQRLQISAETINITPDLRKVTLFAAAAPPFLECGQLR